MLTGFQAKWLVTVVPSRCLQIRELTSSSLKSCFSTDSATTCMCWQCFCTVSGCVDKWSLKPKEANYTCKGEVRARGSYLKTSTIKSSLHAGCTPIPTLLEYFRSSVNCLHLLTLHVWHLQIEDSRSRRLQTGNFLLKIIFPFPLLTLFLNTVTIYATKFLVYLKNDVVFLNMWILILQ